MRNSHSSPDLLASVFRTEWPRIVATLVRDFRDVELAEDVAQEAFLAAARAWDDSGVPDKPGAWLVTAARRRAVDRLRRGARYQDRLEAIGSEPTPGAGEHSDELIDDQLALLCGCCHPALNVEAQVALTLRVVGGLSTEQIAHALFVSPSSMERRLTRAKAKIRSANIPFRVPGRDDLVERLRAVCHVVHLIFTEGHTSANSVTLVRGELCDEAAWLSDLLVRLVPDDPEVLGLAALVQLVDARRSARLTDDGELVTLEHQDRSRWDQTKVAAGLGLLARAHSYRVAGPYQLQAALAALHSSASSFADTNWSAIMGLYDVYVTSDPSPVIELNRAVAVSYRDGPAAGLALVDRLLADPSAAQTLGTYHYSHVARGEMLLRLSRPAEAIEAFRTAERLCGNETERAHVGRRIAHSRDVLATVTAHGK